MDPRPAVADRGRGVSAGGLDYALVGNGRIAALIDPRGRIGWWCFPRFDADPVFSRLLAGDEEKGFTDVVLENAANGSSAYDTNTPILTTTMIDADGAMVRITDFAPCFRQFGRLFHPAQLVRRIEPLSGIPRIAIRIRPTFDYGRPARARTLGSSHIRYTDGGHVLRVTTDAPLSYITEEQSFALTRPLTLVFGPDEPFDNAIEATAANFEARTREHWREWVRSLAIPYEWQDVTIRAAITLRLCSFEETGAIVAAHTTSIPEAPGSERNWDYRYCWLRDAHFVVQALNRLGATNTMVNYLDYIATVASARGPLKPVYGIVPDQDLEEWRTPHLAGFEGNGPVRVGNAAVDQAQNDVYGSVILAAQQMFIDRRLVPVAGVTLFRQLESLGERAFHAALEPDAGIWEYRGRSRTHSYSAAMCWAACDRLGRIALHLGEHESARFWRDRAHQLRETILERAWHPKRRAFTAAFGEEDLDASVLLFSDLGIVAPGDPRFVATVERISHELTRGDGHMFRYVAPDDFGAPETAFIICRFWMIDALASMGRKDEAREHLDDLVRCRNPFGLMSEDIDPTSGRLWGNIPQTYSMAGLIVSTMRLSRSWEEAWTSASS